MDTSALNQGTVSLYHGKTVLVVGAARSGIAAAELLLNIGARVILNDSKQAEDIPVLPDALYHPNCLLYFGQPAEPLFPGCDFLLISPGIAIDAPLVQKAREAGFSVIGELGFAASCATQELVAVSGTNGKTTTVSLLGEIFSQAGRVAHVAGNIGYPLSAAVLRAKADDVIVVEVSSFQLETAEGFHPKAAALLNITPDHLDRHKSMDVYVGLKQKLFQNMGEEDVAVLNAEDETLKKMAGQLSSPVAWFSRSEKVDSGAVVHEGRLAILENGQYLDICAVNELKIPGAHNVENALAASAVAYKMGVPLPVIAYALKSFMGVEHRIEFTAEVNGVRYLNDSKGTNPDSTVKAVESMTGDTILIAGGYDKQVPFDALANTIKNQGAIRHAVLLGQTRDKIALALEAAGFLDITLADGLEDAVKQAARLAKPGWHVLFSPACASFDMFHDYEERGRVFKALVHQLKEEG